MVDAVVRDPLAATVPPRMQAIARYAVKLTAEPWAMTAADLDPMRAIGLSEVEIADVNYICGYFNLMNRLASGLGVEPSPGMAHPPIE
jgi:uncharacterized peroxidase-related enzyme